jgi:transglutaminase-like putative cysteine protease
MQSYLASSEFIDWQHSEVTAKAARLAEGSTDKVLIAKLCFEFVRDEIRHSFDFQLNPVTCRASEVLTHRTGYCYAKSHLLAALLRASGIPTGLCYQRLSIEGAGPPFCLHGLNAVYFDEHGWFRMDARGNKPGVDATFDPPNERLAFATNVPGETNLPEIWPEPLPVVIQALQQCTTWLEVWQNLPDLQLLNQPR